MLLALVQADQEAEMRQEVRSIYRIQSQFPRNALSPAKPLLLKFSQTHDLIGNILHTHKGNHLLCNN